MPMNYGQPSSGSGRGLLNGQMSRIAPQGSQGGPSFGFSQRGARMPASMPTQSGVGLAQRPSAPSPNLGGAPDGNPGFPGPPVPQSKAYGPGPPPSLQVDWMDPENGDVLEAIVKNWNRRNKTIDQDNKKMQSASPLSKPRPMVSVLEGLFGSSNTPARQWFQNR